MPSGITWRRFGNPYLGFSRWHSRSPAAGLGRRSRECPALRWLAGAPSARVRSLRAAVPAPYLAATRRRGQALVPSWRQGFFVPGDREESNHDPPAAGGTPLVRRRGRAAAVAGVLGGRRHLRAARRRVQGAPLRARHVPVPLGRPPHGPRRGVRDGRRGGPLLAAQGLRRAAPPGLGLLRAARRERGDPARRAPGRVDVRQHRDPGRVVPPLRGVGGLVAAAAHQRPGVLPLDPVALPAVLREGAGLSQGVVRELVPLVPDRARQRAGGAGVCASGAARRRPSGSSRSGT